MDPDSKQVGVHRKQMIVWKAAFPQKTNLEKCKDTQSTHPESLLVQATDIADKVIRTGRQFIKYQNVGQIYK